VALLQEVPPWWPPALAARCAAEQRTALTSRNAVLPLRRALAERWPDVIKSNGGGANAVLARWAIVEHRAVRLRRWPERRVAQFVRLEGGAVVANYHATTRPVLAREELARLWAAASGWARAGPVIVGGDLNLRDPAVADHRALHAARRDVDHVFVRGVGVEGVERVAPEIDGTGQVLSDHPALIVSLTLPSDPRG
jgi:endonuclease/exonuclease/phosphatase family metal-dependent hydrolase